MSHSLTLTLTHTLNSKEYRVRAECGQSAGGSARRLLLSHNNNDNSSSSSSSSNNGDEKSLKPVKKEEASKEGRKEGTGRSSQPKTLL